jgi:hypothetical protein
VGRQAVVQPGWPVALHTWGPQWVIFDRAARRFKSGYVGSASNSDGILCGVANGGQCQHSLFVPVPIRSQAAEGLE